MTTAEMLDRITETSPRTQARIAGVLYLVVIVTGIFAEIFVRQALMVSGDAAATAANILAHEQRFRWGFVGELIACACNIPIAVIFYNLFKVVNRSLTLAVVFFTLVGTAIESVVLLDHFEPLILLKGAAYLNAFTPKQLQAQAYASLNAIGRLLHRPGIFWILLPGGGIPDLQIHVSSPNHRHYAGHRRCGIPDQQLDALRCASLASPNLPILHDYRNRRNIFLPVAHGHGSKPSEMGNAGDAGAGLVQVIN